jgi:hypothetical protein
MVRSVMYGMAWAMQEFGYIAFFEGISTCVYVPLCAPSPLTPHPAALHPLHALCTLQLQLCTLFALCVPCALRVHLRVCVTASQSVSTHGSVWRLCGLCS